MIKVAVIGATGFTGEKIVDIILNHPESELVFLSSRVDEPKPYSEQFPRYKGRTDLCLEPLNAQKINDSADVVFLSLPHTVSFSYAPLFLKAGKTVIDLSADYRLKNYGTYEKYYKVKHTDLEHLSQAVYGLPEINRLRIKSSSLIANPGCYPTVSSLCVLPVVKRGIFKDRIIIDAKSGITGAGRKPKLEYNYAHLNENMYAYKLFEHQHKPEIIQVFEQATPNTVDLLFTPQVMGFERGIYVTSYVTLSNQVSKDEIIAMYREDFSREPFVRVFDSALPQLKDVRDTNFCDIGLDVCGDQLIICACIDNLMKGAAGQAVQNMNIRFGLDETAGLL